MHLFRLCVFVFFCLFWFKIFIAILGHMGGAWSLKARGRVRIIQGVLVGVELGSEVIIWIVLAISERSLQQ